MSQFLACIPGRPVGPSTLTRDVARFLKEDLTGAGWRMVDGNLDAKPATLYFIPPESEEIGTAQMREVVFFEVTDTAIHCRPIAQAIKAMPQSCYFKADKAGSVPYETTINGVKVSQDPATQTTTNTALDNLRFLFEALKSAQQPQIQDWEWNFHYKSPQNANDTNYILGVRKTAAPNVAISANANLSGGTLGSYREIGYQRAEQGSLTRSVSVNIDLVNGFIYFLQINKRGLALATRTNIAYSGPIHACYGDHKKALAALPDVGPWAAFLNPIELLVGTDEPGISRAKSAKLIGICAELRAGHWANTPILTSHPFCGFLIPDMLMDITTENELDHSVVLLPSGYMERGDVHDDFQIHKMTMPGSARMNTYSWGNSAPGPLQALCPPVDIDDWYHFFGSATDENLQFCADAKAITKLKTNMDRLTNYASIELESIEALPSKGVIIIENEAIEYTGISENRLTGCQRAKYATKQSAHFIGCNVHIGLWFIKIGHGCIFAGHQKP